jgi:hypothetical protein
VRDLVRNMNTSAAFSWSPGGHKSTGNGNPFPAPIPSPFAVPGLVVYVETDKREHPQRPIQIYSLHPDQKCYHKSRVRMYILHSIGCISIRLKVFRPENRAERIEKASRKTSPDAFTHATCHPRGHIISILVNECFRIHR